MSNYHVTAGHFQPSIISLPRVGLHWISKVLLKARNWVNERHTRNVLSSLDCATLADIGVPHENMSLGTGELNRYPVIIRPNRLG